MSSAHDIVNGPMGLRRAPSEDLRLFVAVYPPAAMARAMLAALGRLDLPGHRPTPAEHVHLTLQFIGDTRIKDLERVRESVERAASGVGAFRLRPLRLIGLPVRGPTRLIAAETDDPAPMLEIQRRLAHRLARSPRARPGDRFLPHMTLARFQRGGVRIDIEETLDLGNFRVEGISLMKSVLRPDGAAHTEVARFALIDR